MKRACSNFYHQKIMTNSEQHVSDKKNKYRHMKKVFGLLLLLIIGFTSCEGRRNSSQALSESIEEFRKTATIEVDVFVPETYLEQEVDTILSNGYRVRIKTFIDEDNNVLFSKIKDTINYQTYYRNYKFNISVIKNGKLIYNETFNKKRVNKDFNYNEALKSDALLADFYKLAVLKSIQVNHDPSLKNKVGIDILYSIPESERYASHTLLIDEKGKSNIINVELK